MSRDWERDTLTMVGQAPAPVDAAVRLAAIVRARARDDADRDLLLDALGLTGRSAPAKSNVAVFAHGSQSGVDFHLRMGHTSLCRACQRWVDVREGRPDGCGDHCGSVSGYWRHRNAREPTCAVSRAAYRVYQREQNPAKRVAR